LRSIVIDASVAIKWYIPEPLSEQASKLFDSLQNLDVQFLAPDLIIPEIGNVLWKKVCREELSADEARTITSILCEDFPVTLVESSLYLNAAMELAFVYRRTIYDSLYMALAIAHEGYFVTADKKMVNALSSSSISQHIMFLTDTYCK